MHVFIQLFEGLAGVVRNVRFGDLGEVVEVGPKEIDPLNCDDLDRLMDAVRIFTVEGLPEPLEGLPFTQAGQSGAGYLTHFWIDVPARRLKTAQEFMAVQRFPPPQAA